MKRDASNEALKSFYESAYASGESNTFTFFENGKHVSEDHPTALTLCDWKGKKVLDVGCGTGMLVRNIAALGAFHVHGIDYAVHAIEEANKIEHPVNSTYEQADAMEYQTKERYDVVITLGTAEHLDDPALFLRKMASFLNSSGEIILACPHFLNPRGYVWMALAKLLNVPMSLSDLHFIHPWDIEVWAKSAGLKASLVTTVDKDWACGDRLIRDFNKRLRNALRDANLSNTGVDSYISYLEELVNYLGKDGAQANIDGATAFYRLTQSE